MFPSLFKDAPPDTYVRVVLGVQTKADFDNSRYINAAVMSVKPEDFLSTAGTDINCFFAPAVVKTKTDEKPGVYASKCCWVDMDDNQPLVAPFPPTFIVNSGHGYHGYWVLNEWCTNMQTLEGLNKMLAQKTGADISAWNCNRVLRIPGSVNHKSWDDLPPVQVRLMYTRDITYSLTELALMGRLDPKLMEKLCTGDSRGYKSTSERDWSIISKLFQAGATEEFIWRLAQVSVWGAEIRSKGEKYFKRTVERAQQRATEKDSAGRLTGTVEEHEDHAYHMVLSNGARRRLSTFVFTPNLLLEHPEGDAISGEVRAVGTDHVWQHVTFTRKAFNSHAALVKELPLAAWQFLGGDAEVRLLLPHIMSQLYNKGMPKVKATGVLGRHGDVIVGVNHVITNQGVRGRSDSPIVYLETGRERPAFLSTSLPEEGTVTPVLSRLLSLNDPETIYPMVGWFAATAVKPLLESVGVRMPILDAAGTRGSGKTTTVHLLQQVFGTSTPVSYNCNTTRFVSLALLGSTNAVPISFTEFRASTSRDFLRYILMAYDTGHDARGQQDQTTKSYPLMAPFVLDGEDVVADAAARERIIAVQFHPESLTPERKEVLKSLTPELLSTFAIPFLRSTLQVDVVELWTQAYRWILTTFPEAMPDRIRNNLTVVVVGWLMLGITPERSYLDSCLYSVFDPRKSRTVAMVDDFIEAVVNAAAAHSNDFVWRSTGGILQFHFATAYQWWAQLTRRMNERPLAKEALATQMKERLGEGNGQYMLPPVLQGGRVLQQVHLQRASQSGLDISTNVSNNTTVTIEGL